MKTLAIIPARGGSKGLRNKNIRKLIDKPLIGWTIKEVKKVKQIDEVIVSTDSRKIASIAKKQELIFLQGSSKALKLPARSPARKLLQYVRDEAHRFAQHYFHILRRKKTLGR